LPEKILLTPHPLGPTMPIVLPGFNEIEKLSRTKDSGLDGYANETSFRLISPKLNDEANIPSDEDESISYFGRPSDNVEQVTFLVFALDLSSLFSTSCPTTRPITLIAG